MDDLKRRFLSNLAQTSDSPIGLEIDRAEGSWLHARDGRRYLDLIAGIGVSALGHGHPAVIRAIEEQARRHLHVMVYGEYVIEAQVRYASRLVQVLPEPLSRVYFTNSGAEAIEGAMKLARKFTGRSEFVAFDGAYHGDTTGALALAGNASFREPFGALIGPVRHLPYGEVDALDAISDATAAVMIEPVQAEGGVRIPTGAFMHALRERCNRTGAVLVFDEVLTGMGRTGRMFALEHFDVVPDVVVLAKAVGGGLPLGAFCAGEEALAVLAHDPPLGHITTFGGHPLSCAAGCAALDVILESDLQQRALTLGNKLLNRLRRREYPAIKAIRGLGLLIGLEFQTSDQSRWFVAAAMQRGIVVNWTLNADRVVRLAPPLTISEQELDLVVDIIHQLLTRMRG
ncbi:MAG TPA: aspartate aminotransferase family protein [Candidatus Binataceae bacterium]|nr:aspartate aminotransferase family protein [Candidatus Binataceae bacterium]